VLKGAQDDLQKELLKEAAKGSDRCKSAEAFVDEDSEFSTNFVREVSNGDKNLELAKAELRELELKLLKSSDLSWAKEDSLEQFRTLYQKKDLIQMLELGSNARLNIISDVSGKARSFAMPAIERLPAVRSARWSSFRPSAPNLTERADTGPSLLRSRLTAVDPGCGGEALSQRFHVPGEKQAARDCHRRKPSAKGAKDSR
jgi:hypothetical protein